METSGLKAIERIATAKRPTYDTIKVSPLTPLIGAEVAGFDLSTQYSNRQLDEVRQALLEHHVLVFRDQKISPEDHKRFGRHFGRLHVHPLKSTLGGDPELLEVIATKTSKFVAGEGWHTDVTCDVEPPMGSLLHITKTPEIGVGGDTLFANMYLAYDMLSDTMKSFLEGLTAVHDGSLPWVQGYGYAPPGQEFPKTEHPVIIRHPETGRKLLFVNSGFTSHIVQLSRRESRTLLDMLFRHVETEVALHCRVRWAANTLVFWDNRCTQHHAVWDYYPLSRYGNRVSMIGERPAA